MIKNGIYGYYDIKKGQIVYIGQSKDILSRHSDHIKSSRYNQQAINRILQNNPDRYKLVIIKARSGFSKQDRDILEKHYIEFYNTFSDKDKFNYTSGGDFCPSMIPEIAKKISKSKRGENHHMYGKKHTKETIERIRVTMLSRSYTEETIERMKKAKSGSNHPMYGKHHTKETIEKISKANSGINNPFYGKHHTEEAKRKMSTSKGNSIGYRRVSLSACPSCKSGKRYKYRYYDDGKRRSISSVNLEKLKKKVLEKGLPWEKIN